MQRYLSVAILGLLAGCGSRSAVSLSNIADRTGSVSDRVVAKKDFISSPDRATTGLLDEIIRACVLAVSCSANKAHSVNDCLRAFDVSADFLELC